MSEQDNRAHTGSLGSRFPRPDVVSVGAPAEQPAAFMISDSSTDGSDPKVVFDQVNHAFRTPLTLMLGSLEAMRKREDIASDVQDTISVAYRNGVMLLDLVNNLIDLSLSQSLRSRLKPVDLSKITRDLASLFESSTTSKTKLRFVADIAALPDVYMDETMWRKIVINLLANAMRLTFDGEIALRFGVENDMIVLEVRDTGAGFPSDQIPALFSNSYDATPRGGPSSATSFGLKIVQQYVEALSGRISVSSIVGQGSAFRVEIPVDLENRKGRHVLLPRPSEPNFDAGAFLDEAVRWIPNFGDERSEPDVSNITRLRVERPGAGASGRPRVLVVEDNPAMVRHIETILGPYYELVVAETGNAAISRLGSTEQIDLVLTESKLIDLPGRELLNVIRQDPRRQSLPVLFIADRSGDDLEAALSDIGADDYVIKPFTSAEVIARVRILLERTKLKLEKEAALRQAQRMEAIGQLTGGLAHDFSNLLVAIIGSLDLAERKVIEPEARKLIHNALQASQRGARLTKHLLSFSQKRELSVEAVNVNDIVTSMSDLLSRALGGMVGISLGLEKGVWQTAADTAGLELALINLALNAGEAMPEGGYVTIRTQNVPGLELAGSAPRDYVRITFEDTGVGMTEDVIAQAFEPFFTTKQDRGSGLGLTQVRTAIRQLGGDVALASVAGKGTTASIYLPREANAPVTQTAEDQVEPATNLRVLIVDDDDAVREVAATIIEEIGHSPRVADSGRQALSIMETETFDLVVVDYAMPGMTGIELVARIKALYPRTKILFTTGYADTTALTEQREVIMRKPFEFSDVVLKISQAMSKASAQQRSADVVRLQPRK